MTADHNEAVRAIMPMLMMFPEPDAWVVLESLAAGLGAIHGRNGRGTAKMVELMAERLATGERPMPNVTVRR